MLRFTTFTLLLAFTTAWTTPASRREALQHMTTAVIATSSSAAFALPTEETPRVVTRMGGLLEPYQDGPRGFRLLAPSGWNKFDGEVGAYDVKWQDLVDPLEQIKLSSTPVKSSIESVAALGTVEELGPKLAAKRNQATLVQASERITDGILFYTFEFALPDQTHQLLLLTIHKSKLWSLDANARNEGRWKKRSELYANVVGSFMPKLT
ncbi:photosystem II oxygen-evolving enhancer protein 2 [Fistulifera solaris]|uniref:Photosystem II oxygen-evolving enhancer protein 2 n=1 Tax=Fistulifera solaris TaxID=1519565 RepID=A0A1Z5JX21_FISSO|nr:photosystem II oxygen-evolving enhancer protein 2 [Fistulifera solaris]|eukprot:GAX18416.1 photosystem II oxygen-evolving enhancer protein 2 [Fistulifera solaris]